MSGAKLQKTLVTFIRHIESIKDTLPMTLILFRPYQKKADKDLTDFINNNVKEIEDDNGEKSVLIKVEEKNHYDSLNKNFSIAALASKIIPESLFVSLVSQYDSYLNKLLRAVFEIRPEILNGSDRNLTYSQLVELTSLEDAREYIVDKEIECVLRKSHSEHFDYLENKLGIPLRKKLPAWKTFIELTERRNLFVHCDGVVSNQYIDVCKKHDCEINEISVGDKLSIPHDYFTIAYECLFEIAVKLTHTIWRKLLIQDLENADKALNSICYDLICSNEFNLADILLDFACKQNNHFNDETSNIFLVNKSLSKYLADKKEAAVEIIKSKDWSASSYDFKLAFAVLTDNTEEVFSLMKKIGKDGDVIKEYYKIWPLFKKIRTLDKFKETYNEIFDEDYNVLESPKRPVQELLSKLIEKDKAVEEKTKEKVLSPTNGISNAGESAENATVPRL